MEPIALAGQFRPCIGRGPLRSGGLWALRLAWGTGVALLLAALGALGQPVIGYSATDLVDTTPGQDLWRYTYFLSGFVFHTNQGFSIFFDDRLYKSLNNPQPNSSSDWSVIAVQPDVILHQPGFLDGQSQIDSPTLAIPFQVDFVWLGQGTPGAQPFDIYDSNFSTLYSGVTVVPEPRTELVVALGLLWLMGRVPRHSAFRGKGSRRLRTAAS